jgi:hypothetical protein
MSAGDPLAATMLSAAYMLAHDLVAAEAHARRALSIDGGSAWAWGRLGWLHAYRDDQVTAIEYFKIAQVLALDDPLSFLWSIGVAGPISSLGAMIAPSNGISDLWPNSRRRRGLIAFKLPLCCSPTKEIARAKAWPP